MSKTNYKQYLSERGYKTDASDIVTDNRGLVYRIKVNKYGNFCLDYITER